HRLGGRADPSEPSHPASPGRRLAFPGRLAVEGGTGRGRHSGRNGGRLPDRSRLGRSDIPRLARPPPLVGDHLLGRGAAGPEGTGHGGRRQWRPRRRDLHRRAVSPDGQRWSIGTTSRDVAPVYTLRGRKIIAFGSYA